VAVIRLGTLEVYSFVSYQIQLIVRAISSLSSGAGLAARGAGLMRSPRGRCDVRARMRSRMRGR
jgi:hypothetical protein